MPGKARREEVPAGCCMQHAACCILWQCSPSMVTSPSGFLLTQLGSEVCTLFRNVGPFPRTGQKGGIATILLSLTCLE